MTPVSDGYDHYQNLMKKNRLVFNKFDYADDESINSIALCSMRTYLIQRTI